MRSLQTAPTSPDGNERHSYWDRYYRDGRVPEQPSAFAQFVRTHLGGIRLVYEYGCGSGRDAFYFAQTGWPTIAIDASEAAIAHCVERQEKLQVQHVHFVVGGCQRVDAPHQDRFSATDPDPGPILVYARFFLHAINEEEQRAFFDAASHLLQAEPGFLALEFRTLQDRDRSKAAPAHYRRFVDPQTVVRQAEGCGLQLDFFVEGLGFAKHGQEDAHVARCIFSRGMSATS